MPMIKLQSSDGEVIETDIRIAKYSGTIEAMLECVGIDNYKEEEAAVPLPNVSSAILRKVLQWAEYHMDDENRHIEDISSWNANFLKTEQSALKELYDAADFLDMRDLLDATAAAAANDTPNSDTNF